MAFPRRGSLELGVMNMAKDCEEWQEKGSPGKAGVYPQFAGGFSSISSTPTTTIRLRDIYDPKQQPTKTPVRIRPPSPRPPTVKPAVSNDPRVKPAVSNDPPTKAFARVSSDPPTKAIVRKRSKSLTSVEKPKGPRSPQVRFVDSLGLELENVKFFKVEENPLIPPHVIFRLMMSSELAFGKSLELSLPYFKPCFPENMGAQPSFLKRLCRQRVCLEQVMCSELGITGTAQVLNLAFEKEVTVHYSFTNWRTCTDTKACWVSNVCRVGSDGPESDIFRFRLPVPPFILQPGAILEFAICYRIKSCTYWDNNDGHNYKLSCHSYKLTVPKECEDSMLHFT